MQYIICILSFIFYIISEAISTNLNIKKRRPVWSSPNLSLSAT